MPWLPTPPWRLNDDDYVDHLRRNEEQLRRYRPWLIALNLLPLAGFCVALVWLAEFVDSLDEVGDAVGTALLVAVCGGLPMGFAIGNCLHQLFELIAGGRARRLLIRHYRSSDSPADDDDRGQGINGPRRPE